jgi:uncharacterized membrane protein YgaE (UPF0421/DUF939 family)
MTRTATDEQRTGQSAVLFLLLCVRLGPHLAVSLVVVAAIIALWIAVIRRYPAVGRLTGAFLGGFVSGLFSGRRRRRR